MSAGASWVGRARRLGLLGLTLICLVSFTGLDLMVAPSPAAAATRRRKKRKKRTRKAPAKKPSVTQSKAPTGAAKVVPGTAPKKEERVGPASLADMRRKRPEDMSREDLADQKRSEAIEQLKQIIPKISNPSQKADLYFQLAELWWEKSKYVYFVEMESWDKSYEKWVETTNRGETSPEPTQSHRESELYRTEAIKLYRRILDEFKNYPRSDEVLFNLAFNMYETDRKKEGVNLYWDLIRKYPSSRFVPDAYLQMGEHYFTGNNVFKAQKAYQKAYDAGDDRIKVFATYKLAWCDYNLGEYGSSLDKFKLVVDDSEKQELKNVKLRGKIQLKDESLRDMVLAYAMLDTVEPAIQYYVAHSGKKSNKWIARLADTFYGAGKNEEAILSYRYLLNADANNTNAPNYQSNIVRAYANMQDREQVLAEMQRLVDIYGPDGPWAEANRADEGAIRRAYRLTEGTQRELVTEYHQEAQKTKYVKTYRLAAEIYKRYLEKFSDSEYAYRLRFYYSEILYTLQEFETAAGQYLKVVEVDPEGQYTLQSAYSALLCYEKLACIDRGECSKKTLSGNQKIQEGKDKGKATKNSISKRASKDDEEEEIPKWESKQIDASDAYVKVVDSWRAKNAKGLSKKKKKEFEADEIVVRYKAAFLLYNHRHYVEAAKRFETIILKWPADKWAVKAADLVLDALNTKERWVQLNDLARKFRANDRLTKKGSEFGTRLNTLIEGSQFKLVMGINEEKKFAEAAVKFRAFVKEFPKSHYADTALYNAMVIFDKAKELDKALKVGVQLNKSYPESELQPRVIQFLGSFYERIADYPTAARYYRLYVDNYLDPKSKAYKRVSAGKKGPELVLAKTILKEVKKKLPDSLFNAALWYEGIGANQKAIAAYLEYVGEFKKRPDVPDIFFNVGLIYEHMKDYKNAATYYENYIKKFSKRVEGWQVVKARFKAAQAFEKGQDAKSAKRSYGDIIKSYPKLSKKDKENPVVRDAIARAEYLNLQPGFDAFIAIKLDTTKQREVTKRLDQKIKSLQQIEKNYAGVLSRGSGDWGICALTRIGLAYKDLARNLLDAPIPPGLDSDQEELYRTFLEEKAFPLEDKAIEALEKALAKGHELSVYNDCTLEAQQVMLEFRPNAFGTIPKVSFFGSEFFNTAGPQISLSMAKASAEGTAAGSAPAASTAKGGR